MSQVRNSIAVSDHIRPAKARFEIATLQMSSLNTAGLWICCLKIGPNTEQTVSVRDLAAGMLQRSATGEHT